MAKNFRVYVTRTVTLTGSVVVPAKDAGTAESKVQSLFDSGKFGIPLVRLKGASKLVREWDGDECNDEIEIDNSYPEED